MSSWRYTKVRRITGPELMSELYVDELVDGSGRLILPLWRGLTRDEQSVSLDSVRSVSGLPRFDYAGETDGCDTLISVPPVVEVLPF